MKPTSFLLFCLTLFACHFGDTTKNTGKETPVKQVTPSLSIFADTVKKLSPIIIGALDSAVHLYDVLAPADSIGADSAAALLITFAQQVVAKQNDRLQNDGIDYSPLLNPSNNNLTEQQKAISSALHEAKLKLVGDGEGGVTIVPAYETILPTIKAKTSAPVDSYLDLIAKEDTTPVFLDAGLAIEITALVDRLIVSENLLLQKLPKRFAVETARLNLFYTNALIRGSDNSPSLEDDGITLTEAFRQGYEYLLTKYPQRTATAKINVWTAVIKSADKRKINDYLKLQNE